jgi:hypothetical protein
VSFRPSKTSLGRWAIGLAAAFALGACGSAAPAVTPGATTAIVVTPAASAPAAATAATAPAATSAPGGGTAIVNLRFTGTSVFDAKGTKGTCKVLQLNGGPRFGFEATDVDYPGLGLSYSMAELNANAVDVKWVVNATTAYGNNPQSHIDLGADHRTVVIDQDLMPFVAGGVTAGPEHVSGTITCP